LKAFPRLNNIGFWCALLWIYLGCIIWNNFSPSGTQGFTNFEVKEIIYTGVVTILHKSSSLPDSEIDRGQEHATKGKD